MLWLSSNIVEERDSEPFEFLMYLRTPSHLEALVNAVCRFVQFTSKVTLRHTYLMFSPVVLREDYFGFSWVVWSHDPSCAFCRSKALISGEEVIKKE